MSASIKKYIGSQYYYGNSIYLTEFLKRMLGTPRDGGPYFEHHWFSLTHFIVEETEVCTEGSTQNED
jgi:hypothetical protein